MKPVRVLRHNPNEPLGHLEVVLREERVELEVVNCFSEDWSRASRAGFDPRDFAGLIVMGGPMNVDETERYPFLATETVWLKRAVEAELPTLGVCLGGQLLAKSLGAAVTQNPVQEIGWYEVELADAVVDDPLFAGAEPRETVFQWHGDAFDLPAGAVLLARGASCRHQAFRYGTNAYGLQFHPEATPEIVELWLELAERHGKLAGLDYIDPAAIRGRTSEALAAMRPFAERLLRRFAGLCRQCDGAPRQDKPASLDEGPAGRSR